MGRVVWIDFSQVPDMAPKGAETVSVAFSAAGKSLAYDFTTKSWLPKAADALRPLVNQQTPALASLWSGEFDVADPPADAGTIMVDIVHSRPSLKIISSEPIDLTPKPVLGSVNTGAYTVNITVGR